MYILSLVLTAVTWNPPSAQKRCLFESSHVSSVKHQCWIRAYLRVAMNPRMFVAVVYDTVRLRFRIDPVWIVILLKIPFSVLVNHI